MMNKKKLLSTICAAALTVSVVGGSIVSAAAAGRDVNILKGKVTDIEETTITLELAPVGAPGQKDDGTAALLPAAKPDGDIQDDSTPSAKPDGEERDDLTPPEKPADDNQQTDRKQPPEKKSVEVDVADAVITEDGQDATVEDIEVGDMLTVELDEDGNAVSVTIDNLPAPKDEATAADEIIVPVGQKRLQCRLVTGGDPAHSQPRQREHLGHAADGDALFVQVGDGGAPAVCLGQVAVYLVAENVGVRAAGDVHDLL